MRHKTETIIALVCAGLLALAVVVLAVVTV